MPSTSEGSSAAAQPPIDADTLFGLRRYLNDVLEAGTVNEQVVARTALRMIAMPPAAQPQPVATRRRYTNVDPWEVDGGREE